MTLEDVESVKNAVVNTTDGVPGTRTIITGRRFTANLSMDRGYGKVSAERVVGRRETTTIDPSIPKGAAVGTAAAIALAPAASTTSPREAFNAIVDRFNS